jgi:hypothetical protein
MKILILFMALILPLSSFSQLEFQPQLGYGSFNMKEMTQHLKELSNSFPVEAKVTDEFPNYWYYELIGSYTFRGNLYSGVSVSYGSTGGRAHYSDYSGEVVANLLVKGITIVPIVGWKIPSKKEDHIYILQLRAGLIAGKYDLSLRSAIGTQSSEDHIEFSSMNVLIEPGFRFTKMITYFLGANVYVGYNLNLAKGRLYFEEDSEYFLRDQRHNPIHLDWSGLRTALGVTFRIAPKIDRAKL